MNDEQIEKTLRKAPASKAPDGLAEKLKADIHLPPANLITGNARTVWERPSSWTRRWLPALSFAVIILSCVLVLAVQTTQLSRLTQQNTDLRANNQNLESLQQANVEVQRLRNENQELERLRKDNAELNRLRGEIANLRGQLDGLESLRAENQRLRSQIKERQVAASAKVADDTSDDAKEKADSIHCINNLKQVGLAFRIWAGDNNDKYPNDFLSMSNELSTPIILQCPSDKSRKVANWDDVASGNVSYHRVTFGPAADETHPDVVLVQCPIHGHVLLCDGSVQKIGTNQNRLTVIDGVTHFK